MQVYYADHHAVPLPAGHRFPMAKYALLKQWLLERKLLTPAELFPSDPAPLEAVRLAHTHEYVDGVMSGSLSPKLLRGLGFPWSKELVARSLASVGGTLSAARAALRDGIAGNLAGGTHHAYPDRGEGFCVFNDLGITALKLLKEALVQRVLVLDLDVHQGNGTAVMLAAEPRAFTCSLHGQKNYPFQKEQSDLDVGLPDGTSDDEYLAALRPALALSLQKSRPQLILYQAGVDALKGDRFGRLALTHAGLAERDRLVLQTAHSLGIPIALTLGGGYAEPIEASVLAYVGTYQVVREIYGNV